MNGRRFVEFIDRIADLRDRRDQPIPSRETPRQESPWVDIAYRDGLEWFRDHERYPEIDWEDWVRWVYHPSLLRGIGASPAAHADQLTPQQLEAVQAATAGLRKAHDLHRRRRQHPPPGRRRDPWRGL